MSWLRFSYVLMVVGLVFGFVDVIRNYHRPQSGFSWSLYFYYLFFFPGLIICIGFTNA